MFAVTNRAIDESKQGWDAFGETPSTLGANELRVIHAWRSGGRLGARVVPERKGGRPPSVWAARWLAASLRRVPRPLVVFVHGFNTTVQEALERAARLEVNFGVAAVAFCWPSNGGGARGIASYRADKRDALASVGAFARFVELLLEHNRRHARPECTVPCSLLAHSMGVHLVEQWIKASAEPGDPPVFANVLLVAGDTNAGGHAEWVDRIAFRRRLYIVINENDAALAVSRAKTGADQHARLGHWTCGLDARQATYIDFTGAGHVGASHACFEGEPLRNAAVRAFFRAALHGAAAEGGLAYDPRSGAFRVP